MTNLLRAGSRVGAPVLALVEKHDHLIRWARIARARNPGLIIDFGDADALVVEPFGAGRAVGGDQTGKGEQSGAAAGSDGHRISVAAIRLRVCGGSVTQWAVGTGGSEVPEVS